VISTTARLARKGREGLVGFSGSCSTLFIQEKVHPKVLIDDLLRRSKDSAKAADAQIDLFADFNGLPSESAKTEFYQHDANWQTA